MDAQKAESLVTAFDLCGFFSDVLDRIELEAAREALGEPSKLGSPQA